MKIEITADTGQVAVYEKKLDTRYKQNDIISEMLEMHTKLLKEGYEVLTYEKQKKKEDDLQF